MNPSSLIDAPATDPALAELEAAFVAPSAPVDEAAVVRRGGSHLVPDETPAPWSARELVTAALFVTLTLGFVAIVLLGSPA